MTTLDDVRDLARTLAPTEKAQLISELAQELAAVSRAPANGTDDDAWADLERYCDEVAQLPPLAEDSADVLSAMRR